MQHALSVIGVFAITMALLGLISGVPHEVGHVLMARAMGNTVSLLEFGLGEKPWKKFSVGDVTISFTGLPFTGVAYIDSKESETPLEFAIYAVAGVTLATIWYIPWILLATFFHSTGLLITCKCLMTIELCNLFPFMSLDGMLLLYCLLGPLLGAWEPSILDETYTFVTTHPLWKVIRCYFVIPTVFALGCLWTL